MQTIYTVTAVDVEKNELELFDVCTGNTIGYKPDSLIVGSLLGKIIELVIGGYRII